MMGLTSFRGFVLLVFSGLAALLILHPYLSAELTQATTLERADTEFSWARVPLRDYTGTHFRSNLSLQF